MHTIKKSARSASGVLAALAVAASLGGCAMYHHHHHDGRGQGPDGSYMDGRGPGPDGQGMYGRGKGPDDKSKGNKGNKGKEKGKGKGKGGRGKGSDGKSMDGRGQQRAGGGSRPLDMQAVCAAYGQGGGQQAAKDRAMLQRDLNNMTPEMRERHMEIVRSNCAPSSTQ